MGEWVWEGTGRATPGALLELLTPADRGTASGSRPPGELLARSSGDCGGPGPASGGGGGGDRSGRPLPADDSVRLPEASEEMDWSSTSPHLDRPSRVTGEGISWG